MSGAKKNSRRVVLEDLYLQFPANGTRKDTGRSKQAFPAQKSGIPLAAQDVHAGLWLDKYIVHLESHQAGSQNQDEEVRQALVREVANLEIPRIYPLFYRRWQAHLQEAGAQLREFAVQGRMAVGLGNEGVLETSIALHRTYGVPYIPGSALKGLAAAYARLMAGDDWQQRSKAYKVVFGDTANAGYIIFFDALYIPETARKALPGRAGSIPDCPLCADVITVHHPNYYQGKKDRHNQPSPPADWDSPTPIPFLSAIGDYLIALAAPPELEHKDRWIESVFEILTEALLALGVGAKTSSGYGRMAGGSPG